MKHCNACGAENKPEAKFCRKCGAPISMIAAVAASADDERTVMMPAARAQAPGAPQDAGTAAPPVSPPQQSIDDILPPIPPAPKAPQAVSPPRKQAAGPAPDTPARASRTPLLLALGVAALAVLAAGGYFVWSSMQTADEQGPATVAQTPPLPPAPEPVVPPPAPPVEVPAAPPPAAEAPAAPAAVPEPPPAVPEPEPAPAAAAPEPAKAKPATERALRAEKPRKKEAEARPQPAAPAPVATPEPVPAPAPAPEPQAARWTRMQEEMRACGTFNVFCREQVRWKYCAGHWGKVPECPGSGGPGG